jgi:hypothetical protein
MTLQNASGDAVKLVKCFISAATQETTSCSSCMACSRASQFKKPMSTQLELMNAAFSRTVARFHATVNKDSQISVFNRSKEAR